MIFFSLPLSYRNNSISRRKKLGGKIIYTVIFILLLSSCTRRVQLERDEYHLISFEFKGNKQISTEELELLIPPTQKPNRRILYFTPYVWFYNVGKSFYNEDKILARFEKWNAKLQAMPSTANFDLRIEKKRKRYQTKALSFQERLQTRENWWMKNVGEPPAKITESAIKRTSENLNKYLFRKGFFDNQINYQIDSANAKRSTKNANRRVNVAYLVNEKKPYIIENINYEIED